MNTKLQVRLSKIAKCVSGAQLLTSLQGTPIAWLVHEFEQGLYLTRKVGENTVFTMMYGHTGSTKPTDARGMTGFFLDGKTFTFDRRGIEDSWQPDEYCYKGPQKATAPEKIAEEMIKQLDEAEARLVKMAARERDGTVINFGPTSRTLLPAEIANYAALIKSGKSFSLNPSGMGTGYRFYANRRGMPSRYGSQCVPASVEAKKALGEPTLVYDTTDHD